VFFENDRCLRCGAELGFDPATRMMVAGDTGGRRCANSVLARCNWLVEPGHEGELCRSCALTRTRPDDADLDGPGNTRELFGRAEDAKRRLVFQLLDLGLPVQARPDPADGDADGRGADAGLAVDLLVRHDEPITIGHADGVITIDLAESDDAYRERMRAELGEVYRTMLGHLRHEVGHYYWDVLIQPDPEPFRAVFGDERADYGEALTHHYEQGPPPAWSEDYVSAYAAAHPWEDWAETWAHYLHIRDALETAAAHGVIVSGPRPVEPIDPAIEATLISAPELTEGDDLEELLHQWLPLTYALNAINRSMGKDDLYPFVLSANVVAKLRFVHSVVSSV
jgi:hypothetical protein